MRKMTKTAAVLAAMSAMTVASASLAFAATDNTAYSAIGKEATAAGANSGEWNGSNVDGWTFTPTDGTKLKGTWAQIDGAWYYFGKDGIMAREELMYLEGETYYFDSEGRMMANGWVGFDNDSDVVYDYDLDVNENIEDITNPVFRDREDAYETVWMYFNADGTAKDDEWFQSDAGLWYYFDDIVMVCGDYDHDVDGTIYGFAEDGHMYVGWEQNLINSHITAPNKSEDTWYYYNSNGKKFNVANDNNGYGWKKIDGKWYCFRSQEADANGDASDIDHVSSVGTLIVNAYFTNDQTAGGNSDYYYVDKNGVMATGVVTVDKNALYITAESQWNTKDQAGTDSNGDPIYTQAKVGKAWDVYFNNDGKAQEKAWSGTKYYAAMNDGNVKNFNKDTYGVTTYKSDVSAKLKGALVKEAFVTKDSHLYYVDKYGDKLTSSALQVGYVALDSNDDIITNADGSIKLYKTEPTMNVSYKVFVLFNAKGEAYELDADAINDNRTVKLGSKKYTAIGNYSKDADDYATPRTVTLFMYDNYN